MRSVSVLIALVVMGCQAVDPKSPEGAFKRIAPCIDKADARCLYDRLDRNSRWSIQTMHRTLTEVRNLVEKHYPSDAREEAYGIWREEALARDPAELFEKYCKKQKCLEKIAMGFGAVTKRTQKGENRVLIETTRGGEFEMFFAEERWGITTFERDLQAAKLRILDRVAQVKKNAAQFEEQRSAGTIGDEQGD